ncbi:hypothetical protein QE152_g4976 [Popillia japonica]|uniref:Uncharacterized protein n=1 Tax=Popillia japonica TaxID=7064 RepID=A0AAW1MZ18_POPJA
MHSGENIEEHAAKSDFGLQDGCSGGITDILWGSGVTWMAVMSRDGTKEDGMSLCLQTTVGCLSGKLKMEIGKGFGEVCLDLQKKPYVKMDISAF